LSCYSEPKLGITTQKKNTQNGFDENIEERICSMKDSKEHGKEGQQNLKLHKCLMCGKGFSTNSNKREHERRHVNMKLYKCNQCNMRFFKSQPTRRHKADCNG